jgi:phage-related protein
VVTNGFQKKSQKTPRSEIEYAEQLKKKYFHEKDKT